MRILFECQEIVLDGRTFLRDEIVDLSRDLAESLIANDQAVEEHRATYVLVTSPHTIRGSEIEPGWRGFVSSATASRLRGMGKGVLLPGPREYSGEQLLSQMPRDWRGCAVGELIAFIASDPEVRSFNDLRRPYDLSPLRLSFVSLPQLSIQFWQKEFASPPSGRPAPPRVRTAAPFRDTSHRFATGDDISYVYDDLERAKRHALFWWRSKRFWRLLVEVGECLRHGAWIAYGTKERNDLTARTPISRHVWADDLGLLDVAGSRLLRGGISSHEILFCDLWVEPSPLDRLLALKDTDRTASAIDPVSSWPGDIDLHSALVHVAVPDQIEPFREQSSYEQRLSIREDLARHLMELCRSGRVIVRGKRLPIGAGSTYETFLRENLAAYSLDIETSTLRAAPFGGTRIEYGSLRFDAANTAEFLVEQLANGDAPLRPQDKQSVTEEQIRTAYQTVIGSRPIGSPFPNEKEELKAIRAILQYRVSRGRFRRVRREMAAPEALKPGPRKRK